MQTLLDCGHAESEHSAFTTGYGTDAQGRKHCYACCAKNDVAQMVKDGRTTLYLTSRDCGIASDIGPVKVRRHFVSNWPGSLEFPVSYVRKGSHNMARTRYDAWFTGPDNKNWHAVQYGENTQIAHCRRTKA